MAVWYDRDNPPLVSDAAKQSQAKPRSSLGGENRRHYLADLRERLHKKWPRAAVDAAMHHLAETGKLSMYRLDDPRERTGRHEEAAIDVLGDRKHIFYYGGEGS